MRDEMSFIDYYAISQVAPDCDEKTLEAGYRSDHQETANIEKFNQVVAAYRVLRHPDQRADYDILYAANVSSGNFRPFVAVMAPGEDAPALSDASAHARILEHLFDSRRKMPEMRASQLSMCKRCWAARMTSSNFIAGIFWPRTSSKPTNMAGWRSRSMASTR